MVSTSVNRTGRTSKSTPLCSSGYLMRQENGLGRRPSCPTRSNKINAMGGSGNCPAINFSECIFGGAPCVGRGRGLLSCLLAHRDIWQQCKNRSQSGHAGHSRTCCRLDPVAGLSGPPMTSGLPDLTSVARMKDGSPTGPRKARPDDRLRRNPPLEGQRGGGLRLRLQNPPLGWTTLQKTGYLFWTSLQAISGRNQRSCDVRSPRSKTVKFVRSGFK
jgi:hypothetical protein